MREIRTCCCRGTVFGEGVPKIGVPLLEGTREDLLERAREYKNLPCDFVEWRADYFGGVGNVAEVEAALNDLRDVLKDKPLLFTLRTKAEGGMAECEGDSYRKLLCDVAKLGLVDLLDVEYRIGEGAVREVIYRAHENQTKVILSYHDFETTPSKGEIVAILRSMQELGADMTKVAVTPKDEGDVMALWEASLAMKLRDADRPYVTISMGRLGALTRLTGEFFGQAATFASTGSASAPGQIPLGGAVGALELIHKAMGGHIFLIGFMGVGKSSVSRALSERLGMPERDTDAEVVKEEGREIAEIFLREGEAYFRDLETLRLFRLRGEEPSIVSCGGGMVLREGNVEEMRRQGIVVCLTATPETIYERVKDDDKRPLLRGNMDVESIRGLMRERRARYEEAADALVATDGKTKAEVAAEVAKLWGSIVR